MKLNSRDLKTIVHRTLEHYNQRAEEFWASTRDHDVSQNIAAPIALRYSISIRVWAHMKLIRQIVLTATGTELKKRQRRFSRRFNGHNPWADFDLLPNSSQRWRSQCV
jgi:hypothetical protein